MRIFRKRQILFLALLLVSFTSKAQDLKISWQNNIELKWSDFQGEIPKDNIITKAVTCTDIVISTQFAEGELPFFKVSNYFIKNNSWTRTDSKKVLSHEQLHFDISELFTRKIRERFFHLRTANELNAEIYISEYHRLRKEEQKLQDKYDSETNFTNGEKWKYWSELIKRKLVSLNEFKASK